MSLPKIIAENDSMKFCNIATSTITTLNMPEISKRKELEGSYRGFVSGSATSFWAKSGISISDTKGTVPLRTTSFLFIHDESISNIQSIYSIKKELLTKKLKTLLDIEVEEKIKEGFVREPLDHNVLLSPEIKDKIGSNALFNKLLTIALTEISYLLDKEIGKIGYVIEVSIIQDYEYPDWKDTVIRIKVPIKDPKYVVDLWYRVGDEVWKKIKSIKEDAEEIKKISDDTRISFRVLE